MKSVVRPLFAAILAVSALGAAALEPTWRSEREYTRSPQPVASPLKEGDTLAKEIAAALDKDEMLARSKVTVQPEERVILLTGVAPTQKEADRAKEIVAGMSGGKPVVNAMQIEHVDKYGVEPQPVYVEPRTAS